MIETTKKKEPMVDIKDLQEKDWRGILALIIIVGGFVLVAFAMMLDRQGYLGSVLIMMVLIAEWYFKSKQKSKAPCPYLEGKEDEED